MESSGTAESAGGAAALTGSMGSAEPVEPSTSEEMQEAQETQETQETQEMQETQKAEETEELAKRITLPSAYSTKELTRKKVWTSRPRKNDPDAVKKMGRIHAFVFHPKELRCVGFLVKRPDLALMFHRQDMFVAYNGFQMMEDDHGHEVIVLRDESWAVGKGACKAQHIKLDDCVIWIGLPVMGEDGTTFGTVDDVLFDKETGEVISIEVSLGATANTLLGQRVIAARDILGFKRGMGTQLYMAEDDNERALGALLVSDAVKGTDLEGGIAEKAGAGAAVVTDKAKKTYRKVVKKAKPKMEEASAAASKAAKVAGEAATKGAYVAGRQLGRSKGMFGRFKDEFDKAMRDE